MSVRVRVQNFQSIEDSTVVIDGFTVVTGPNNSGKTAFLRAVRGVFTNPSAAPLVRHGASHLTVTLTFDDGNIVVWEKGWTKPGQKGGTINRYTLNGKLFDNVGRSPPGEVLALGVQPVQAGSENLWPQIADQFSGVLFLVNSPGSVVAEAVADVDRVGKLSSALKLAESDKRGVSSTLKVRRKDLEQLEVEMDAYKGLGIISVGVSQAEEALSSLSSLHLEVQDLRRTKDSWERSRTLVDKLCGIHGVQIPSPEEVQGVEGTRDTLEAVRGLARRRDATVKALEALDGIQDVRVPESATVEKTVKIQKTLVVVCAMRDQHRKAQGKVSRHEGMEKALASLPQDWGDTDRLRRTSDALSAAQDLRDRLTKAKGNVAKLETFLDESVAKKEEAHNEVVSMLGDLGECPTCGTVHKSARPA